MKNTFSSMKKKIKPKAVPFNNGQLVKTGALADGQALPVVIEPVLPGVDPCQWAAQNMEEINKHLHTTGGVLFRGFDTLRGSSDFERFIQATGIRSMKYMEGATPRTKTGDGVFTSTEFPEDQIIAPHNELSYVMAWPMRISFMCETPSPVGGETPIADVRKVLRNIDPDVLQPFVEKGWMLMRNFGLGFGPEWRTSFHVETPEELEAYCNANDVLFEWLGDDALRTRQIRPVVTRHPVTAEDLWFNHLVFWHISSLQAEQRAVLERDFDKDHLPFNTYYGDGGVIPDDVVEHINEAYRKETIAFPWQTGDLLVLDNMLIAHGRNSYKGERRILANLGNEQRRDDL